MDPVVVQAGAALVKLMATDTWAGAKEVVVRWWRKHHPEQAGQVGADLDQLREVVAEADTDVQMREALSGEWQLRFYRLLAADPGLAQELRNLLDHELNPRLADINKSSEVTQHVSVTGNGNDTRIAGRDIGGSSAL